MINMYGNTNLNRAVQSIRKDGPITMKSLLSEEEKKQIREETTADVTARVTADVTVRVTEKKTIEHVLAVMKRLNVTAAEAMDILGIEGDLRETVREMIEQA